MKLWASTSDEGWLLPSDVESWQCTQTLDLRSSAEPRAEDAFFNQVVALPRAGLFLLANAKKNAMYAVHIEYGPYPAATCLDYIAEFTVTMPILSLTGTSDSLPDGEHVVQVYCFQTHAIQQYALDLSQCLPPPVENSELEKTDSSTSCGFNAANSAACDTLELSHGNKHVEMPVGSTAPLPSILSNSSENGPMASHPVNLASSEATSLRETATSSMESKSSALPLSVSSENIHAASPPLPLSPRLSGKLSGLRSPSNGFDISTPLGNPGGEQPILDYSIDRRVATVRETFVDAPPSGENLRKDEKIIAQNDISMVPNPPLMFKHPTHLITPSEILSASSESSQISQGMSVGEAKIHDVAVNNDIESVEVEVKVVGETGIPGISKNDELESQRESHVIVAKKKEKSFCSQASDLSIQMTRDYCVETYSIEEAQQATDANVITKAVDQSLNTVNEDVQDLTGDVSAKIGESTAPMTVPQSSVPSKAKKQKGRNSHVSGPSSPSPSPFNSTDSSNEPSSSSSPPSIDAAFSQLFTMQEMLDQVNCYLKKKD